MDRSTVHLKLRCQGTKQGRVCQGSGIDMTGVLGREKVGSAYVCQDVESVADVDPPNLTQIALPCSD